jgi:HEAT repeat protein
MMRARHAILPLLALSAAVGCKGEEKRQTPAEWMEENTIILRQLRSYDREERYEGISRFLRMGKERGIDVVNYILDDPNLDDRAEVVLARILAEWKDDRAIPRLLPHVRSEDRGAAEIAKEGLIIFDDSPRILEAMKELARDPSVETRLSAAEVVSEMKSPSAKAALVEMFKGEENADVRGVCFLGVLTGSPRDPRRTSFLIDVLDDKDPELRRRAWDALAFLNPPIPFDPDGGPAVRKGAIDALRRWAESRGKPPRADPSSPMKGEERYPSGEQVNPVTTTTEP